MLTLRTVFLSLHAASGVLGLLVGAFAFRLPHMKDFRTWLRRVCVGAQVSLAVFLVATVSLDWSSVSGVQHVLFAGLTVLAAVLVARIFLAFRVVAMQRAGSETKYLNHVYFTFISLWEGFFIVGLIDLGAPGWLVAAVGVEVLIVGATVFSNYKRQSLKVA